MCVKSKVRSNCRKTMLLTKTECNYHIWYINDNKYAMHISQEKQHKYTVQAYAQMKEDKNCESTLCTYILCVTDQDYTNNTRDSLPALLVCASCVTDLLWLLHVLPVCYCQLCLSVLSLPWVWPSVLLNV